MTKPTTKTFLKHWHSSDIRGIAQLATQATNGVTRIVEEVHQSVLDTINASGGPISDQTRGITGLVYKSIYGVTQLLSQGVDEVLTRLGPSLQSDDVTQLGTPQREMVLSALNGVIGDHLVASNNSLAIPMTLRYQGRDLNWQAVPSMPEATGKLLLLIHGLCLNDRHWHAAPPDVASYAFLREQIRGLPEEAQIEGFASELLGHPFDEGEAEAEFQATLDKLQEGNEKRAFAELQARVQKLGVAGLTPEEKQAYIDLLANRGNRS